MNEIQTNFLLGQTLLKVNEIDFDSIKDLNIGNDNYLTLIEDFVNTNAQDVILLSALRNFIFSDDVSFAFIGISFEKNNEYLTIRQENTYFTIEIKQMIQILKSYIDYRGVPYPTGIFNDSMYVYFTSDAICDIVNYGFSDQENDGYEIALKESLIDDNVYSIKFEQDYDVKEMLNDFESFKKKY